MEDWQARIERKIDQMSDAIVSLARMEERMITLFKRMDMYDERQNEIGKRVGDIEKSIAGSAWVERVMWLVIAAVVGAIGWLR